MRERERQVCLEAQSNWMLSNVLKMQIDLKNKQEGGFWDYL